MWALSGIFLVKEVILRKSDPEIWGGIVEAFAHPSLRHQR